VEPKNKLEENGDAGARRISVQPEDTALEVGPEHWDVVSDSPYRKTPTPTNN